MTDKRRNNRGTQGNRGGAPVRKITLTREAAQKLKILTLNRRSIVGNEFSAGDMMESLISVAYADYDTMVSEIVVSAAGR